MKELARQKCICSKEKFKNLIFSKATVFSAEISLQLYGSEAGHVVWFLNLTKGTMIFTFEKLEDNNEQQHTFMATDDDTNTNYEIKFTLVIVNDILIGPKNIF